MLNDMTFCMNVKNDRVFYFIFINIVVMLNIIHFFPFTEFHEQLTEMQKWKSAENKNIELLKINLELKMCNRILQNQTYRNQTQITKHTLKYNMVYAPVCKMPIIKREDCDWMYILLISANHDNSVKVKFEIL